MRAGVARRRLGRRGPLAPVVGVGAWQLGGRLWGPAGLGEALEVVSAALELGVALFDTAELYGMGRSEELLGEALRRLGGLGEAIIVTKVAGFRVSWSSVRRALEASRRRLGRTPDVALYHWPPPLPHSACEAARLLERAAEEGLAAYVGLSNFNAAELAEAVYCMRRLEPVVDQVHYSLAHRVPEAVLEPAAARYGVTLMAWGPLAKGALAGRRAADNAARRLDPVFREAARDETLQETLASIASKHGASRAEVALAWLIRRGAVPIPGARRRRHVEAAAGAAALAERLSSGDLEALDRASRRYLLRWGTCYRELHWNRYLPAPVQALLYRGLLRGV